MQQQSISTHGNIRAVKTVVLYESQHLGKQKHPSISLCLLQEAVKTTDALNMRELPRRVSSADISDFTVTADPEADRRWIVTGEAIDRFAAMTNWDYYEATLRFQKVLDATGERLSSTFFTPPNVLCSVAV